MEWWKDPQYFVARLEDEEWGEMDIRAREANNHYEYAIVEVMRDEGTREVERTFLKALLRGKDIILGDSQYLPEQPKKEANL